MTLVRFKKPNTNLFNHLMDDFFQSEFLDSRNPMYKSKFSPATNIKETDNSFELELAVPGMKKDSFSVEVEKENLVIKSSVKNEKEETKDNYTRKEFSFQSFEKSFTLPENVDADNINAKYENGVLSITIPKIKEVENTTKKQISVM